MTSIKPTYVKKLDFENGKVEMSHGAGGLATAQLIEEAFASAFKNTWLDDGHDGATLPALKRPVVVSCDAHVVSPLFSPAATSAVWPFAAQSTMSACVGQDRFISPPVSFWKKAFHLKSSSALLTQ